MAKAAAVSLCFIMAGIIAGCSSIAGEKPALKTLTAQNEQLQQEVNQQKKEITGLTEQLVVLRGFPGERLDYIPHVTRIEFGHFTRVADEKTIPPQGGVIVYLALLDQDGSRIKAGGDVSLELWDLQAAEGKHRLGSWHFALNELARCWLGGFLADHYKFSLGWPGGLRPAHENLTVKLVFQDALTGSTFEIQKLISPTTSRPR